MILCIDIENTYIRLGLYKNDKLIHSAKLSAKGTFSCDEYTYMIKNIFELRSVDISSVTGAVMASVVPSLTRPFLQAVRGLFGIEPLMLELGVKTSLDIKGDNPVELGSDIIANCVAALRLYKAPLIIFDYATATTVSVINSKNQLVDVFIAPGLRSAADALSKDAAGLPDVELCAPKTLTGKNTQNSMKCGILYSAKYALSGFYYDIKKKLDTDVLTVVATGEYAPEVIALSNIDVKYQKELALDGLKRIYDINVKTGR